MRGDLVKTLHDLLERRDNFDYIIVETTGLADPSPVAVTFNLDPVSAPRSLTGAPSDRRPVTATTTPRAAAPWLPFLSPLALPTN